MKFEIAFLAIMGGVLSSPQVGADCVGERWSCLQLGGDDYLNCAKHDGCSWSGGRCGGNPTPCSSFPTKELCYANLSCEWEGENNGGSETSGGGQELGTYEGTATTTLRYYDYVYDENDWDAWLWDDGPSPGSSLEFKNEQDFTLPVQAIFSTPYTVGEYQVETNPLNLLIATQGEGINEGEFFIRSAAIVLTPYSGSKLLLQYWELSVTPEGMISGTLTDTHRAEGAVWNDLWAFDDYLDMTMSEAIHMGATMEGYVTSSELQLTITGDSDSTIEFTIQIEAWRA